MGRRSWDRPCVPYLVLAVLPLLTLPLSAAVLRSIPECGRDDPFWDETHWEFGYFELALLPGLADLLPFAWLASRAASVRRAAVIAGVIGAVRFVVPQVLTLLVHTSSRSLGSNSDCTIDAFFGVALLYVMPALWLASVAISAVIVLRSRRTRAVAPD